MVTFNITQEMLDEANGKIYLDSQSRAAMYSELTIDELLGQSGRIRVGRIESDGSQTILDCHSFGEVNTCS